MLVVGLTGSVGMGKSAMAAHMRRRGIPVCDADQVVHDLYSGAAVPAIEEAFPGVAVDGAIDRGALSAALQRDQTGFKRLERIVHPLVRDAERDFLQKAQNSGADVAVLEIPLLFETGADAKVDATIVVSAPAEVQRARVMARPGMTEEKFELIIGRQMPDAEKRQRADFVVDTGLTMAQSEAELDTIIADLRGRRGTAFDTHWA